MRRNAALDELEDSDAKVFKEAFYYPQRRKQRRQSLHTPASPIARRSTMRVKASFGVIQKLQSPTGMTIAAMMKETSRLPRRRGAQKAEAQTQFEENRR